MKKNTLKNSTRTRLTLGRETIQRLAIAQLEGVDGALANAGPRSNHLSCVPPCTTAEDTWFAC